MDSVSTQLGWGAVTFWAERTLAGVRGYLGCSVPSELAPLQ